jgi:hypothetical protein
MRNVSYIFGIAGGGCVGYSLGRVLGSAVSYGTINYGILLAILGTGAGLIGIGIACEVNAKNKSKEAIVVYNNYIKQKNSKNINLGFTTNGVLLQFQF